VSDDRAGYIPALSLFLQSGPHAHFFIFDLREISILAAGGLVAKITELVEPVILEMQLELVEVQFRRESTGQVLRIIVYSEDGVSIDDCVAISREVGRILEVEDIIDQAYHLEVSSPGLDRPLKTTRDFLRCLGRKIKITYLKADEKADTVVGEINDCNDDDVTLKVGSESMVIPLVRIKKALQVIEF